jgi:pimeloyl-ACP methyl ester carboxylesterase
MLMQFVPRWTNTNDAIISAYVALLERVGESVVVAHSQGASLALRVLGEAPTLVKALVAVEPYAFVKAENIAKVSHIPVLFVWGDYLEQHPNWAKSMAESQDYMDVSQSYGGKADLIYLPEQGITGNSHMLMMEKNNLQIAALIQEWLEKTL